MLTAVTVAPGMTAPLGSVIVPVIDPVWASKEPGIARMTRVVAINTFRIYIPSFSSKNYSNFCWGTFEMKPDSD
jgi:hypothetical protein